MGKRLIQTSWTRTAQILGRFTACSHVATSQAFSRWKVVPVKWDVEKWESGNSRTLSLSRLSIGLDRTASLVIFSVVVRNQKKSDFPMFDLDLSLTRHLELLSTKNRRWQLGADLLVSPPTWWTRSRKPSRPKTLLEWLPWNQSSSQDVKNTQE